MVARDGRASQFVILLDFYEDLLLKIRDFVSKVNHHL